MSVAIWALVQNLGLLSLGSFLYANVRQLSHDLSVWARGLAKGSLFGGFGAVTLLHAPFEWQQGIFLDLRLVPVALAASFGGRRAGLISCMIVMACRILLGGIAAWPGVAGIGLAAVIGDRACRWEVFSARWLLAIAVGATFPVLLLAYLLPGTIGREFLMDAAMPLAGFNLIGALVLSVMLSREAIRSDLLREYHLEALTDALTGLANRRAFDLALAKMLATEGSKSMLFVDVDELKLFNDRHGHRAGDAALKAVAGVLRDISGWESTAARIGGDEFAVLLPGRSHDAVDVLSDRIDLALSKVEWPHEPLSVSIGGVTSIGRTDQDRFVTEADAALYSAKEKAKSRLRIEASSASHAHQLNSRMPKPCRSDTASLCGLV